MSAPLVVLLVAAAVWSLRRARHHAVVRRRLGQAVRAHRSGATVRLLVEGRLDPPPRVAAALAAIDCPLAPAAVWSAWVATSVVVLPLAALAGGPGLAVTTAVVLVGAPVLAAVALGDRADRRYEDALPGALERVAGALRSGASPRRAVEEAAGGPDPLGGDLTEVAAAVTAGEPLVAALDRWAARRPLPGVRLAVAALALGAETGGAHARALDGVAATLRGRRAVAGEVRALAAQARLSGLVITVAPVGFGMVAAASDPRTATFLLRTPAGLACLVVGLALNAGAALWMHRLAQVEP